MDVTDNSGTVWIAGANDERTIQGQVGYRQQATAPALTTHPCQSGLVEDAPRPCDPSCQGHDVSSTHGEANLTQGTPSTAGSVSETIIRTQDDGWSTLLSAVHGPSGWTAFTVVSEDHPPLEMLGDAGGEAPETMVKFAGPAVTWEGALELLDRFLWHVLTPEYVHPDFRQAVLAVVRDRAADKNDPYAEIVEYWLPNWESKCSPSENV